MNDFENILQNQVKKSSDLEKSLEEGIEQREQSIQERIDSLQEMIDIGYDYLHENNKVVIDSEIQRLQSIIDNTDSSADMSFIQKELDEHLRKKHYSELVHSHEEELRKLESTIGLHRNQKFERN